MDLTTATPVEIDTLLAPIWERQASAQSRIVNYKRREAEIFTTIEKVKRGERVLRITTALDGIELMEDLARLGRFIVAEGNKLAAAEADAAPYEAEYTRRGGWNRVFLAKSVNGHAHNGTECSTCHNGQYRTAFAWLIRYSGQSEADIVADAGERACTTCYPTAPVDAKGTKMFTPDEEEAAKAREEREAERTRKAKEAADKSITTPEGEKLYAGKDHVSYDVCKTLRTAEIAATDVLLDVLLDQTRENDPEWAHYFERKSYAQHQFENTRHAWYLLRAVAHKKGLTFQEVFETHEKKAQAKLRKIQREWAKDPVKPNRTR
jgi:cytochrome c5